MKYIKASELLVHTIKKAMFSSDKFETSPLSFKSSLIYTNACEELVYIMRINKPKRSKKQV